MLLRRVIEHVKAQNWTAIALDFVIVVMGVFIGIQVANWNDARAGAAYQKAMISEFADDLRTDLEEIEIVIKVARLRYAAAESIANRVNGWRVPSEYPTDFGESAPLEKLSVEAPVNASDAIYFAQRYTAFDQERRTYNALLAGGDLTFGNRSDLGKTLWRHYLHVEEWIATENTRQKIVQRDLQQAFARHGLSSFEDVDWERLEAVAQSDPALLGALKTVAWEAAVQYQVAETIRNNTRELINALEAAS